MESLIGNANSYFNNENIELKPIVTYENIDEYIKNLGNQSFKKYFKITVQLIKIAFGKKKRIIYSNDFQVISLGIFLKMIIPWKTYNIVYHQFEIIEKEKLRGIGYILFNFLLIKSCYINLFISPQQNRLDYFKSLSSHNLNTLLFPNTCEIKIPNESPINDYSIPEDHIMVLHIGTVGAKNHYFNNFIDGIKKISPEKKITFVFVGRITPEIEQKVETLDSQNIILIPYVAHEELHQFYNRADYGLILYKGTGLNYEYCAPNKLYEFWSYGIPVIGHPLQGLSSVFKKDFLGNLINFDDQNSIARFFEEISINKNTNDLIKSYFKEELAIEHYLTLLKNKFDSLGI